MEKTFSTQPITNEEEKYEQIIEIGRQFIGLWTLFKTL